MNWKIERAPQELPAELAIFARRAFVQSCLAYGVASPLEQVSACTFLDEAGTKFFVMTWRTEDLMMALAEGHFYPTTTGGQAEIHFLHTTAWEDVAIDRARRDVYHNVSGLPTIAA
jgi:hypothetical protein